MTTTNGNQQERLSDLDRMRLSVVTLQAENAELRRQLAASEARALQLELHRTYGNPGERLQIDEAGSILRIPPPEAPTSEGGSVTSYNQRGGITAKEVP
jgi:hypothetical protein